MRCEREMVLFAEIDGQRGEVGRIDPDVRFDENENRGSDTVVGFWDPWIVFHHDSVFSVESAALESWCR